jgi:hypothetical protein
VLKNDQQGLTCWGTMKGDCSMAFSEVSRTVKGLAILLMIAPSVAYTQAACGSGALRKANRESLRQSGIAVLKSIEQKNAHGLLSFVSHYGLGFGVDKPRLSREELRDQFAGKDGAYCLFFFTACIEDMGRFKGLEPDEFLSRWKISYVEWLRLNRSYSVDAELEDDDGGSGCGGYFSAGAGKEMRNAPDSIELYFSLENDRWRLVGTVAGVP